MQFVGEINMPVNYNASAKRTPSELDIRGYQSEQDGKTRFSKNTLAVIRQNDLEKMMYTIKDMM